MPDKFTFIRLKIFTLCHTDDEEVQLGSIRLTHGASKILKKVDALSHLIFLLDVGHHVVLVLRGAGRRGRVWPKKSARKIVIAKRRKCVTGNKRIGEEKKKKLLAKDDTARKTCDDGIFGIV